ncbi:hypothetical protein [Kitasatospora sp. NPDC002965]|uniref:hypothetical protein n=1 Tax=Kitasatospora sp. NPDC002965 TaxID=3154775 RepID=UPI0033A98C40
MTTAIAPEITGEHAHGSTIIRALEHAWDTIRAHHPDLPSVVMITGHGRQPGEDAVTWGHHWAGSWTAKDGSAVRPELFASGELLALGGVRIMQTLLHEAAHALGTVRGIKNTSSGGRYHNREFAKLASEVGLEPPARADADQQRRGYSNCLIREVTITRYAEVIAALDASVGHLIEDPDARLIAQQGSAPGEVLPPVVVVQPGAIGTDLPEMPTGTQRTENPRGGSRCTIVCGCLTHVRRDAHGGIRDAVGPRRILATPGLLDGGPITCGVCHQDFELTPEA